MMPISRTLLDYDTPPTKAAMSHIMGAAIFFQTMLSGCSGEFPSGSVQYRAAEGAYDSEQLKDNLNEIKMWHIKHETGLADSLKKGIPVSTIEAAFSGKKCRPTDELKMLWSWRNGEDSPSPFIWYHDFLSMEDALSEYEKLLQNPFIRWDPYYIPVFAFEGEWYATYCGHEGGTSGPVAHFFLENKARLTHINITVFLSTMAETLRSEAVTWENGAMVEDINKVYRIHQTHNHGYEFPYHVPNST